MVELKISSRFFFPCNFLVAMIDVTALITGVENGSKSLQEYAGTQGVTHSINWIFGGKISRRYKTCKDILDVQRVMSNELCCSLILAKAQVEN